MGIKNLLKFLSQYDDIIVEQDIDIYKNKKIAIDISILIYQVVISIRNSGSDLVNNKGEIISHIFGIFNKTISFLEKGIIPIYVFDGKPPSLKKKVLEFRFLIRKKAQDKLNSAVDEQDRIKYFKRSVYITRQQIEECKELLKYMGIPYIEAPEEADSQLAYLCKNNLVYAVLTEDMDILTFGSPRIIRNLTSTNKIPLHIELKDILLKLNLTHEQFIDLCILFGCDYCSGLNDIKQQEIYDTYIKYKNIDDTITEIKKRDNNNNLYINYKDAKNYFINSAIIDTNENELVLKQPNTIVLLDLLVNKYGLIRYKVINKLRKLEYYYSILQKNG
jgi:flap endonuclease-1